MALLRGIREPCRYVAPAVRYAPNFDVILTLAIENQIREALERPATQSRNVEFVGVARRAGRRVLLDVARGLFQRIDETQGERR